MKLTTEQLKRIIAEEVGAVTQARRKPKKPLDYATLAARREKKGAALAAQAAKGRKQVLEGGEPDPVDDANEQYVVMMVSSGGGRAVSRSWMWCYDTQADAELARDMLLNQCAYAELTGGFRAAEKLFGGSPVDGFRIYKASPTGEMELVGQDVSINKYIISLGG